MTLLAITIVITWTKVLIYLAGSVTAYIFFRAAVKRRSAFTNHDMLVGLMLGLFSWWSASFMILLYIDEVGWFARKSKL